MKTSLLKKAFLSFLLVGCFFLIFSRAYPQDYLNFEGENDKDRYEREALSINLLRSSLEEPVDYTFEYISDNVKYIYYFKKKLDYAFYFNYPDYNKDKYFPYSEQVSKNNLSYYQNYYVVYYDNELNVLREDYYENKKLIYYLLLFYKKEIKSRERASYEKEAGNISVFDYFYYPDNRATVLIRYEMDNIQYITIKYKEAKDIIIRCEEYNENLSKNGVWDYFDYKNYMLKRREYWKNGSLIKFSIHESYNKVTYYDGTGNIISKEFFDTLEWF